MFAEQCRRTTGQNVSSDILIELDMQMASSQSQVHHYSDNFWNQH